jgi:hypothetical protein
MKWQFVIIAQIALAGPVAAEPSDFRYAFYERLVEHPDCSGPGRIAYRATIDTVLTEGNRLQKDGSVAVCAITERKGDTEILRPIPCRGGQGPVDATDDLFVGGRFCSTITELRPSTISFRGEFIGCISIEGHAFVGGNWEATTVRRDQTILTNGVFDDPRLELTYNPSKDMTGSLVAPSFQIKLQLDDVALPSVPGAFIEVFGFNFVLPLIDRSKPGCETDPKACWTEGKSTEVLPETSAEPMHLCSLIDSLSSAPPKTTIEDLVPEED